MLEYAPELKKRTQKKKQPCLITCSKKNNEQKKVDAGDMVEHNSFSPSTPLHHLFRFKQPCRNLCVASRPLSDSSSPTKASVQAHAASVEEVSAINNT